MEIIADHKTYRMRSNFGENVKRLRKQQGWSQAELAARVGVHLNHINRIETGRTIAAIDVGVKLAEAFEVTLDYLVNNASGKAEEIRIEDQTFAEKIRLLNSLDAEDRQMILRSIDNALTKQRMINMVKDLA